MAIDILDTHAKERGTFIITVSFTDEDGNAVQPTSLKWSLTDTSGTIINNRENVNIPSPQTSNDIVLSGADLALSGQDDAVREFTAEARYNSNLQQNLPITESCRFVIDNMVKALSSSSSSSSS